MKKSMEIRKLRRKTKKKGSQKYKSSKANKVKIEIKLNIDEQQDAIKHLIEYCGIDDIDNHEKKRLCV